MATDDVLIPAFSLGGYRSFGAKLQRFERFSKVNLLIGPNNCGKSNVLRFIHSVYPKMSLRGGLQLGALDGHFPNQSAFQCGIPISLHKEQGSAGYAAFNTFVYPFIHHLQGLNFGGAILRVFLRKAELDGTKERVVPIWSRRTPNRSELAGSIFGTGRQRDLSSLGCAYWPATGLKRRELVSRNA